ncbi:hypothetical protein CLOP_g15657 [Closterium sp. NIES-67]|nr:hypothetical protein CLOP_g15657 [Closterium sp. NIES-67]
MLFGLRNASAVFQRVMDQVLKTVPAAACYIDDVVIFSRSEEEHAEHLKATLDAIAAAGLTCHPEKCKIARRTVAYLGFEIGAAWAWEPYCVKSWKEKNEWWRTPAVAAQQRKLTTVHMRVKDWWQCGE